MKYYTIGDIARRTGLSATTLRFYDKKGLLPFVAKAETAHGFSPMPILSRCTPYTVSKGAACP